MADHPSSRPKRLLSPLAWIILISVAGILSLLYGFISTNVHSVAEGQVIRSAQLSSKSLTRLIQKYGIHSVISLRGEHEEDEWYRKEKELCDTRGLTYIAIEASASRLPSDRTIRTLLSIWNSSPRPILVHCHSGKDRTGLAAVIFEILNGEPLPKALRQLSWRKLHFCKKETCPLHNFFARYETFLQKSGQPHSAKLFQTWCLDDYYPPPYARKIEVITFPGQIEPGASCKGVVQVTNLSDQAWMMHSETLKGIRFGLRVLGPLETLPPVAEEDLELYFHRHRAESNDVLRVGMEEDRWEPGEMRELTFTFLAPPHPGTYLYQLDMVDEMVTWFYVRATPATYRFVDARGTDPAL
ncbi:MAG TPA: tyrosine-protein phosphatase [Thermoanaerobaculia bacterium]|nr:tyrosine-protein phosphatase [Thermoanaerobaculia bacterium]HUM30305.1 tyrosine-protein phosphatase [Thermoanaerobaculia bacterium]HXK68544.1 tyrosine-protein phosphatase [Thermoanaerobaculia bacterium]